MDVDAELESIKRDLDGNGAATGEDAEVSSGEETDGDGESEPVGEEDETNDPDGRSRDADGDDTGSDPPAGEDPSGDG